MQFKISFIKVFLICTAVLLVSACNFISTSNEKANVLLIGDSISIGYLPFVQELMEGRVSVDRVPLKEDGKPENCQGTTYGIANIDRWIGDTKWDVIHFNFGLHDIKHVNPETAENSNEASDPPQASVVQYKENLTEIVKKLKTTGAKLIFATTTPYPKEVKPYRGYGDEIRYNAVARTIMKDADIPINDLHAFVLPRMDSLQRPVNVHFTEVGSRALAEQVAQAIFAVLNNN